MNSVKQTIYPYHDADRNLVFSKIRRDDDNGTKTFYFERKENGATINNLDGVEKILYRLPVILTGLSHGLTIYLVEGEKDANTLLNNTLIATTTTGTLEWCEEYTRLLKNADVVILYDYDPTGFKRRDLLCNNLYGRVKRLRVVDLPGLEYREKHGLDISNWLEMENTVEQFLSIVEQTPDYIPPIDNTNLLQSETLKLFTFEEFLDLQLPEKKFLLTPFLTEQGLVMLYAKRGVGKTHVALGIAYAVASGGSFLKWSAPEPKVVLYIDGEMPATSLQHRLRKIFDTATKKPLPGYLRFITHDQQDGPLPDLATEEGKEALEPFTREVSLIVVDNISSLFRSGRENEAEGWQPVQDWALELRRKGKSVLFIHHAGKSGQQRGTSKREDILDVVIALKQKDDYKSEHGARFEVRFEKTRHFAGDQASPFQVQLIENADESWEWQILDAKHDPATLKVANMRSEGKTMLEIMGSMNLSKSQVETRIKKAKQLSLLS